MDSNKEAVLDILKDANPHVPTVIERPWDSRGSYIAYCSERLEPEDHLLLKMFAVNLHLPE